MTDPAPLIVSAVLSDPAQERLDALRRAHFPPDRRVVGAHLTLFHKLPGDHVDDVVEALSDVTDRSAPAARLGTPFLLGNPPQGVAVPVECPDLGAARETVARRFRDLLTAQDARRWRPHVTVTNKVDAPTAERVLATVTRELATGPDTGAAVDRLALWRYRGGPWEAVQAFGFAPAGTPRP